MQRHRNVHVTLNASTTVTAAFSLPNPLTVTKSGNGTGGVTSKPAGIDCGSTCTRRSPGTSITLTAAPDAGMTSPAGPAADAAAPERARVTLNCQHHRERGLLDHRQRSDVPGGRRRYGADQLLASERVGGLNHGRQRRIEPRDVLGRDAGGPGLAGERDQHHSVVRRQPER